jgi:hypothetical protein
LELAALIGDPVASAAFGACFALILFAAAWHKFGEPLMFEAALEAYRLLPKGSASALARVLPVVEVLIGVGLLVPATRGPSLVGFAALMLVYACAMAINLRRGRSQIDCGCGAEVHLLSWALVLRNVVLACAAWMVSGPNQARQLQWLDGITLVGGALCLYASYLLFDELLRQHGRIVQLQLQRRQGAA